MVDLGLSGEVVDGGGVDEGKVEGVLSHCSRKGEEEGGAVTHQWVALREGHFALTWL